jgi:hypothetical protein
MCRWPCRLLITCTCCPVAALCTSVPEALWHNQEVKARYHGM